MKPEEEILEKIKYVLSCGNEAQAIRLIEQYGHWKQEQTEQCAINGVSKCAFVFECRDTQGRKAQIFIQADNRETAIQVFETDYEDYKWWQTNEIKHFC